MRTQYGAEPVMAAGRMAPAPALVRQMNSTPLGETSVIAWAEPAVRSERIITAAFAETLVLVCVATRAVMLQSPLAGW